MSNHHRKEPEPERTIIGQMPIKLYAETSNGKQFHFGQVDLPMYTEPIDANDKTAHVQVYADFEKLRKRLEDAAKGYDVQVHGSVKTGDAAELAEHVDKKRRRQNALLRAAAGLSRATTEPGEPVIGETRVDIMPDITNWPRIIRTVADNGDMPELMGTLRTIRKGTDQFMDIIKKAGYDDGKDNHE